MEKNLDTTSDDPARAIHDDLLAQTGAALISGDFDLFSACFLLPQTVDTFDGRKLIETIEDMREVFSSVRSYHRKRNVTDIVRRSTEASFRDDETIVAVHTSRLLSGSQLIGEALSAFSIIKRTSDGWKVASSQYAVLDDPALSAALIGPQAYEASNRSGTPTGPSQAR